MSGSSYGTARLFWLVCASLHDNIRPRSLPGTAVASPLVEFGSGMTDDVALRLLS
jgi:hypothetical protein